MAARDKKDAVAELEQRMLRRASEERERIDQQCRREMVAFQQEHQKLREAAVEYERRRMEVASEHWKSEKASLTTHVTELKAHITELKAHVTKSEAQIKHQQALVKTLQARLADLEGQDGHLDNNKTDVSIPAHKRRQVRKPVQPTSRQQATGLHATQNRLHKPISVELWARFNTGDSPTTGFPNLSRRCPIDHAQMEPNTWYLSDNFRSLSVRIPQAADTSAFHVKRWTLDRIFLGNQRTCRLWANAEEAVMLAMREAHTVVFAAYGQPASARTATMFSNNMLGGSDDYPLLEQSLRCILQDGEHEIDMLCLQPQGSNADALLSGQAAGNQASSVIHQSQSSNSGEYVRIKTVDRALQYVRQAMKVRRTKSTTREEKAPGSHTLVLVHIFDKSSGRERGTIIFMDVHCGGDKLVNSSNDSHNPSSGQQNTNDASETSVHHTNIAGHAQRTQHHVPDAKPKIRVMLIGHICTNSLAVQRNEGTLCWLFDCRDRLVSCAGD